MIAKRAGALCLLWLILANTVVAADKSGVKPQVLSLPSGPGSIEGLGPSFEPQLNTGSAPYSVKIAVPPGVAGHQPELSLQYNSGSGNSPFGLGWNLSVPTIERQTDKGQPRYTAGDIFLYGGEELVPLADGTFRTETESSFMRFGRSGDGWEVRDRSGRIYRFGTTPCLPLETKPCSRIENGTSGFDHTYKWFVDSFEDTNGNRISYSYARFPDSPGQLYLSEVRYNVNGQNFNAVTLDYEPRVDAFGDYRPGFQIRTARRADRIQVWSRGQLVREYRLTYEQTRDEILDPQAAGAVPFELSLLTKVTQFDGGGPASNYLPPLRFGYTRLQLGSGVQRVETPPLNEIVGNEDADLLDVDGDALPDVVTSDVSGYAYYHNLGRGRFAAGDPIPMGGPNPGVPLSLEGVSLADMDGDGLSDLLVKPGSQGEVSVWRNQGNGSWAQGVEFVGSPFFGLTGSRVRLMDVNFDKAIDVVRSIDGGSWEVCLNGDDADTDHPPFGNFPHDEDVDRNHNGIRDGGSWECFVSDVPFAADGLPQVQFGEPNTNVQLADMNGDRLQDVVYLQATSPSTRVVWFWPNMGQGQFDAPVVMTATTSLLGELDLGSPMASGASEALSITDVNGDGLSDLVRVDNGVVRVWLNLGGDRWSAPVLVPGTPEYDAQTTRLRFADLNGNGSTDIIWISAVGPVADRWQYLDFAPLGKPNQLKLVDNGLGRRIAITYRSSTEERLDAREAGNPWQVDQAAAAHRLVSPVTMPVVKQVVTTPGLELDGKAGADRYVTDFAYRDAYYDPYEREFRGFAFAKKIDRGDADAPTQVTRHFFFTGAPDGLDNDGDGAIDERTELGGVEEEALKGLLYKQEVATAEAGADSFVRDGEEAEDANVFTRTMNDWHIRPLHTPDGGTRQIPTLDERSVSFAFNARADQQILERDSGPAKLLRTDYAYDDFGNPIEQKEYGVLDTPGDERFTFRAFAVDPGRWIVDRVCREILGDGDAVAARPAANPCELSVAVPHKVTESRLYYDGQAFQGLQLGQMGNRGNLTRKEGWVEGEEYVQSERKRYDALGNVIGMLDPLGTGQATGGHFREIAYDPLFKTFPVQETIHVGDGKADLVMTADYEVGFGVMTRSTDFNGNSTTYGYDSFGRLTSIVKPYDSTTHPTTLHEYRMADPFRGTLLAYDRGGKLTVVPSGPTPSSVTTRAREQAGQAGTFDTVQYVDGMGRKLATVEEGETGFIVKGAVRFNARASVRDTVQPYAFLTQTWELPAGAHPQTTTQYDATGREILKINPPDAKGDPSEVATVYRPLVRTVFDELHNEMTYVTDGLEMGGEDSKGKRLVEVQEVNNQGADPGRYFTRYEYNPPDRLLRITDALSNLTTLTYDGLQRKTFLNHPDRGVMSYEYDAASNLTATVDAKGQRILYAYEGVNRLRTEDYLDDGLPGSFHRAPDIRYTYDVPSLAVEAGDGTHPDATQTRGFLSSVEDLSGREHVSYDQRGRTVWTIKQVQDAPGAAFRSYKTELTYDSLDRETALVYPDNDHLTYSYNPRRLLEQVSGGPSGAIISSIDYQPSGQVARAVYGDGLATTNAYDPRLRLVDLTTAPVGNPTAPVLSYGYTFDVASNIRRIDDQRPATVVPAGDPRRNTQLFEYDDLYRLTRVGYSFALPGAPASDNGSIAYGYDRLGNMLAQTSGIDHVENGLSVTNLGTMSYGAGAGRSDRNGRAAGAPAGPHALTGAVAGTTTRAYTYDDNGNMTTLDGKTLTWDVKDRLVAVEDAQMRAEYVYDYTDRRIVKRVTSKTTPPGAGRPLPKIKTIYANQYFEIRDGEQPVKYVFNGATRVARITGTLDASRDRVQRVRLFPGWNLFAVVVSASNAASQLGIGTNPNVTAAYRWDAIARTYQLLSGNDPLPVGSVVWIRVTSAQNRELIGAYTEPASAVNIPAGSGFIGVPGFQGIMLTTTLPQSIGGAWMYDVQIDAWRGYFPGASGSLSDAAPFVGPGEALFVAASSAGDLTLPDPASRVRYYHQDHLGSSDLVTNAGGAWADGATCYPFGHPRERTQQGVEPYLFNQNEFDDESSLQEFNARYLAAVLARFVTVDPVAPNYGSGGYVTPQQLNSYAYSSGNPVGRSDPSGRLDQANVIEGSLNTVNNFLAMGVALVELTGGAVAELTVVGAAVGSAAMAHATLQLIGNYQNMQTNIHQVVQGVGLENKSKAALALREETKASNRKVDNSTYSYGSMLRRGVGALAGVAGVSDKDSKIFGDKAETLSQLGDVVMPLFEGRLGSSAVAGLSILTGDLADQLHAPPATGDAPSAAAPSISPR